MKKLFILLLMLVLIVLISGCIKVVEPQQIIDLPPAPVVEVEVQETVLTPGVSEKEEEPKPNPKLSSALAALQKRADEKVKSYSFIYKPEHTTLSQDTWYVKGNKLRAEIFTDTYYISEGHYDNIYIDAGVKTAFGFCESDQESVCPIQNKKFILDYNDVMIRTPYQVVKSIPYGEVIGSELMWDRSYQVARYKQLGLTYKIWIDSFSGLAAKLEIYSGDDIIEAYEYRHLQINNVADSDVEPPKF